MLRRYLNKDMSYLGLFKYNNVNIDGVKKNKREKDRRTRK